WSEPGGWFVSERKPKARKSAAQAERNSPRLRERLQGWLPAWAGGSLAGAGGDGIPVRLSSRSYGSQRSTPVSQTGFDQPLLWVVFSLLAWGLVMVYSAAIALPDNPRFENYSHTHFVLRHGLSMAIAFVTA